MISLGACLAGAVVASTGGGSLAWAAISVAIGFLKASSSNWDCACESWAFHRASLVETVVFKEETEW